MTAKDFTSQKNLSTHMEAVLRIPAKPPKGLSLFSVPVIDMDNKHDSVGDSLAITKASFLNDKVVHLEVASFIKELREIVNNRNRFLISWRRQRMS